MYNLKAMYDKFHASGEYNLLSSDHRRFAKWLLNFQPKNVLDIGSGKSTLSRYLTDVVDFDLSIEALKNSGCGINGTAWALPFKDKSFDIITANGILEHIPQIYIMRTLDEFDRVAYRKICYIAFLEGGYWPIEENAEHVTVAGRRWWIEMIEERKNWLIGGMECSESKDLGIYRDPGIWSFINWNPSYLLLLKCSFGENFKYLI